MKNKLIIWVFVLIFFNSCQNHNELDKNSLSINVVINTSIKDISELSFLNLFFKSYTVQNIDYLSSNVSNEIGINLKRWDKQDKSYGLNLPLNEGNGVKNSMGVYDADNLKDDLDKFDLKTALDGSDLSNFFDSIPFNDKIYDKEKYALIIDLDNRITDDSITKAIQSLISLNKTKCVINILVTKKQKKTTVKELGPNVDPVLPSVGDDAPQPTPPATTIKTTKSSRIEVVKIDNLRYDPQTYSFKWNYVDEYGNVLKEIPDHITVHAHINQNTKDERSFLLKNGRREIEMDVNSEDMEKIKNHCDKLAKITIRLILGDSKLNTRSYYDIPGDYRITCFTKSYCGFLLNNNKKW